MMNLTAKNKKTVIDPVCGMDVVPTMTEIKTTINGDTYYFCAEGCRKSFIDDPENPFGILTIHPVHQIRLIVECVEMVFDAKQGAGKPEKTLDRKPENRIPLFLLDRPSRPNGGVDRKGVIDRIERREELFVLFLETTFTAEEPGPVNLRLWYIRMHGPKPGLLVVLDAKVIPDVIAVSQIDGQSFAVPAIECLGPPTGPFDQRQPIDRLEIHYGVEAFARSHG